METQLLEILKNIRPDVDFERETELISGGVLDSFDMISILAELSDVFLIEIDPEQITEDNFDSKDKIIRFISSF